MNKIIYDFGGKQTDGDASMKDILGGKGANLAQMCKIGLPIPPGFTITTNICLEYEKQKKLPDQLVTELDAAIKRLEEKTGKFFGVVDNVLLLSVRSGAKISMPGMMDTILNLGMNDEVAEKLAADTQNPCFAYDSYRRFLEMFGDVVLGISSYLFEEILENYKNSFNVEKDSDLESEQLKIIIDDYKKLIKKQTGKEFEKDPIQQLKLSIIAVLKSWMSPRAVTYRKINNISDDIGTAVNIQSMVFGNKGETSATGVVFTRNPSNGEKLIFGEYLINAQGEDVVAGVRTPAPIAKDGQDTGSMEEMMPESYSELVAACRKLENHFADMQDIEFTIENGNFYILQTRTGKRAALAALKIAVDMVQEGLISKEEALLRIEPESLNQLLHTAIDYSQDINVIAKGLPASPGAATAKVVFSPYDAEEMHSSHKVLLVRNDTSPEDIKGMHVSEGIITARGGMTSHAAVVARGMGKPCVCGVKGLVVNEKQKYFTTASGQKIKQGDIVTIDGSNGNIITGGVKLIQPEFSEEFKVMLSWADEIKQLKVRANAETALDAGVAIKFGAAGIGLCRSEHMFFDNDKIPLVREMIIAKSQEQRMEAIEKLRPLQEEDFRSLFEIMQDRPVNVRLLDPPLHEFLPTEEKDKQSLANSLGVSLELINHRLHELHELNPMLGHRGCRLGISHPEIYIMQINAILDAVNSVQKMHGIVCNLEIMVPLICDKKEIILIKNYIEKTLEGCKRNNNSKYNIKIGTMIELPRAALIADEVAKHVDYFSFGSNDLTQTTYGISRDDIGSFLPDYMEKQIFKQDPFTTIDKKGVGSLIKTAIEKGKESNRNLSFGVCGEHAGDPESIEFFNNAGLDYISCSPYRIPIARIAAAQSKIKSLKGKNKS